MIATQAELLLMGGIAGLYLYDSLKLLQADEGVLSVGLRGGWAFHFGLEHYTLRGKQPFLPNPFHVHRPAFRFRWRPDLGTAASKPWAPPELEPYRRLSAMVFVMAAALFVLIPLGLFSRLGNTALIGGLALFYTTTCLAFACIWRWRSRFGLTAKQVGALAFESLSCPPFAINLIRHISGRVDPQGELLATARQLLAERDWNQMLPEAIDRVAAAMYCEDEDSPRFRALMAQHAFLKQELKLCQQKKSWSA